MKIKSTTSKKLLSIINEKTYKYFLNTINENNRHLFLKVVNGLTRLTRFFFLFHFSGKLHLREKQ